MSLGDYYDLVTDASVKEQKVFQRDQVIDLRASGATRISYKQWNNEYSVWECKFTRGVK